MGDFMKSAIDILSRGQKDNDQGFVGEIIEVNGVKLKVKKFLAAGGFSNVYVVTNKKGELFAVKRLTGFDKEGCDKILNEVQLHKKLSNDNIIKLHGVSLVQKKVGNINVAEYLLLTELCQLPLVDIINEDMSPSIVLSIMSQAINSINYLHNLQPAIIHRDIKLENYLISGDGIVKLCDFGSATTDIVEPNQSWSMQRRDELQDEIFRNSSPMYRAPEIVDLWENYPIGPKVDIWAIGCVFYCILYKKHPFEDAAKLRIVNGNYVIPSLPKYTPFHILIKKCLIVDPRSRIDSYEIKKILQDISRTTEQSITDKIDLSKILPVKTESCNVIYTSEQAEKSKSLENDQKKCDENLDSFQSLINSNGLLSTIKGGANMILKNFIGTSSKVLNSMHNYKASNIFNITSRIIISYQSNTDILKKYLENSYLLSNISVYNFCHTNIRLPPPVRTIQVDQFNSNKETQVLDLEFLYYLIEEMFGFLNSGEKYILVLQENNYCNKIAVVICALFLYCGLVEYIEDALQIFAVRVHPIKLLASEFRYLNYIQKIIKETIPHNKIFYFVSFSFENFKNFYKVGDFTLFVEIYENGNLVYSQYVPNGTNNEFEVNKNLIGNILITLSIIKGPTKHLENISKVKIGKIQFHTGFLLDQKLIKFSKEDIDLESDIDCNFSFLMKCMVHDEKPVPSKNWANIQLKKDPKNLFSSLYEYNEVIENFVGNKNCYTSFKSSDDSNYATEPIINDLKNIENVENLNVKENKDTDDTNTIPILLDLAADDAEQIENVNSVQNVISEELLDIFEQSFETITINDASKENENHEINKDSFTDLLGSPLSDSDDLKNFIPNLASSEFFEEKKNVEQKPKDVENSIFLEQVPESSQSFLKPNVNNFESAQKMPQKSSDCFADLLGQQGYNFAKKTISEPKTINDLRRKDVLSSMDEESIKIYKWTEGKRANIRALLCSMHTVLWEDAKWTKCEMHQLITLLEVKKAYRKACLAVHPDKHVGTQNEKLSKMIFMELNSAWNNFNAENS